MAALSANVTIRYMPDAPPLGGEQGLIMPVGAISDEFYRGALLTYAVGTGTAVCTSLDASEFLGVCAERKTFSGTAGVIKVLVGGVFWFAAANITNANYGKAVACTAASDNPADLVVLGAGTTGQVGKIIHVDVSATSGWVDTAPGGRCALGTNS